MLTASSCVTLFGILSFLGGWYYLKRGRGGRMTRQGILFLGLGVVFTCSGLMSLTLLPFDADNETSIKTNELPNVDENDTPLTREAVEKEDTNSIDPTASRLLQITVAINAAFVRSGPGTDFSTITTLENGEMAEIIAKTENGDWYNIRLDDGTTGWIGSTVLETIEPELLSRIEIVLTVPAP